MKAGAEPRTSLFVRESGLSDRVDYQLIETSEEKDCIYSCVTEPICMAE